MRRKQKPISFWKSLKQSSKTKLIVQFCLSLFVLYQLCVIFIAPHVMSIAHEKLMPFFAPYASTLALNTSWNFYAPNPIYYHYWTYEVVDSRSKVGDFRWPPKRKESKLIYLNHNRLIYHSRFFIMAGPKNVKRFFIPYLCHLHPFATEITLKVIFEDRPHFKKAKTFKPTAFVAENPENKHVWSAPIHAKCKRKKKLRNLDSIDNDEHFIDETKLTAEDTEYEDDEWYDE